MNLGKTYPCDVKTCIYLEETIYPLPCFTGVFCQKKEGTMCEACQTEPATSRHHLFPKRHFHGNNNLTIGLCRPCHDKIELLIPYRKQPRAFYRKITKMFLDGRVKVKEIGGEK